LFLVSELNFEKGDIHEVKRKHKVVEQGEASIKEESHFVDRRKK
jgi:hypothetical protein